MKEGFGFVIKTSEYTGNFEREMCAFVTGRVGECEVGEEFVEDEIETQFGNVMDVPDDNGCCRPVSLCDDSNNLVIYFETKPTKHQIDLMKERAKLFNEVRKNMDEWNKDSDIKILGFELESYENKVKKIKI